MQIPEASYSQRELIWKDHDACIRGFFYSIQHFDDNRVNATLREYMRGYGFDRLHYTDPHENDSLHWPYWLYFREARRMISDFVPNGSQIANGVLPDGPISRIIALGSYKHEAHHIHRIVVNRSSIFLSDALTVWNEANFGAPSAGENGVFAVGYDAITPKSNECTNLLAPFCINATHDAFGATRMEMTLMQTGQSSGSAAVLASRSSRFVHDLPHDEIAEAMSISNFPDPILHI